MGQKVLVSGAIIQCIHGGQMKLSGGDARLKITANPVLTFGMEAGLSFQSVAAPPLFPAPCTAVSPGGAPTPCVTGPAVQGTSTKLSVGQLPVLMANAQGQTVSGAGPGTWQVSDSGQTLLEAS